MKPVDGELLDRRAAEIDASLKTRIGGEIVPSARLWRELGFPSASALRTAILKGRLSLKVFPMEGRRGLFAFRSELARYLAQQGFTEPTKP